MSFKQGKFYAIQGKHIDHDTWRYLEANPNSASHQNRLRKIARNAAYGSINSSGTFNVKDDLDDDDVVIASDNPMSVRNWPVSTDFSIISSHLYHIRKSCGTVGYDPNSLKVVIVETAVSNFIPEAGSKEETELRKFALDKLSQEEKELLKVGHWDVYHKLGDRSMLDDEEEESQ